MSAGHDAVVVGGGLAGAAFAIALAKAGRDVAVIEREAGPHDKVCGEFLSHEALGYLDALGVDVGRLGAAPIRRVRLSHGPVSAARDLPFEAASLSRKVLDEALLDCAEKAGACVLRGRTVQGLERFDDGWTARLSDGETVSGRQAALACGKHDLRARRRPAGAHNDLIGLKAHFELTEAGAAALDKCVLLGLFPGGYAGLEPVGGGRGNLCLVVGGAAFSDLGRDWKRLLASVRLAAPDIDAALRGAVALHDRPLAVARIPYGLVVEASDDGCWRLGDQAAVVPSFAGEGMAMALHSARLAADAFLRGRPSAAYQARFAKDVGVRVRLLSRLSRALMGRRAQDAAAVLCRVFPQTLSSLARASRLPAAALR